MTSTGHEGGQSSNDGVEPTDEERVEIEDDDLDSLVDNQDVSEAEIIDDDEVTLEDLFVVDDVAKERDEYLDALRRVQAEFDNYRKRMTRQQIEASERATESLLERLLPVLDALDLALAHIAPDAESASPESTALNQIAALLRDTLYKAGLERIDTVGVEFDPTVHDAVAHLPKEQGSEQQGVVIAEVLRAGYLLKGRVVRPAMVQVRG